MQYISVSFVILSLLAAFAFGFLIPIRTASHVEGFGAGMVVGSVFTLFGSLMCGYLIASLGEEWLGTMFGVPIGLFLGCLAGAVLLNYLFGGIGFGIVTVLRGRQH